MTTNLQIMCYHSVMISLCSFQLISWDECLYGTLLAVPCLLRENIVYKKCVEQRQRENIVFKLDGFEIPEHTFVECFKREPKGAMCPSIFELCCHLFSHEHPDTIILSQSSVVSIYPKNSAHGFFNFVILCLQFLSIIAG